MAQMNTDTYPQIDPDQSDSGTVHLQGDWVLAHLRQVTQLLQRYPHSIRVIDGQEIGRLDSAGAIALLDYIKQTKIQLDSLRLRQEHRRLTDAITQLETVKPQLSRQPVPMTHWLERLGVTVIHQWQNSIQQMSFLGESIVKLIRLVGEPKRLRLTSIVYHMERVGFDAVPLILLLSYLVGAVIAFLGATVLREFGAQIYVVELVSVAFLREFAVLLTAIVLAGRTASAFTAQIGAMQTREEIDAIRTIGLDPVDLLLLPRMIAVMVTLPLLTFISMISGLAGGMTVGAVKLHLSYGMYIARLHDTIQIRHIIIGLSKAPLFALVIGLIGCLEGLRVDGSAQSVGERTTASVVQAIAWVIILDAFAALWFMQIGW